jgi:hypothetical protein
LADSLRDELLAIPGIASAEFEGTEEQPLGVRVQLAVGADPETVGREVQRVLASHGMRSQLAEEERPGSVVNLSDYENGADEAIARNLEELAAKVGALRDETPHIEVATEEAEPAVIEPIAGPTPQLQAESPVGEAEVEVISGPPPSVAMPSVELDASEPEEAADEPEAGEPVVEVTLAAVTVEEDDTGVTVVARSSAGESSSRSVPATRHGLDEAAAMAAAELITPDTPPRVVAVTDQTVEGSPVVTVVLEIHSGRRVAGASVVHGSRAYAVALAAWAALNR